MEKKAKAMQKKTSLGLHTETLRRLEDAKLQEVAGGARYWRPIPDDTPPIYDDTAG